MKITFLCRELISEVCWFRQKWLVCASLCYYWCWMSFQTLSLVVLKLHNLWCSTFLTFYRHWVWVRIVQSREWQGGSGTVTAVREAPQQLNIQVFPQHCRPLSWLRFCSSGIQLFKLVWKLAKYSKFHFSITWKYHYIFFYNYFK